MPPPTRANKAIVEAPNPMAAMMLYWSASAMFEKVHEHHVADRHPQQAQTGHAEAHHRAAPEGQRQCLLHPAPAGRLGGAGVGGGGDPHAHEPGYGRQHRPEDVGDGPPRGAPREDHRDENRQDQDEDRNPCVLRVS